MAGVPPKVVSKLDFLKQRAPSNYVAGVGRGATGFTTRSDIGGAVKHTAAGKVTVVNNASGGGDVEEPDDDDERGRRRGGNDEDDAGLFAKNNNGTNDKDYDDEIQKLNDEVEKLEKQNIAIQALEKQ